jgi:hypothetical protein
MSGVIDRDGQQWEHCNECGKFVRIEYLKYEQPSAEHRNGRDLCPVCIGTDRRVLSVHFGGLYKGERR